MCQDPLYPKAVCYGAAVSKAPRMVPTPHIEVAKIAREVLTPVVCRIEGVQRRIKKLANRLRKFIAHNSAVHDANLSVNSAITGLLRLVETRIMTGRIAMRGEGARSGRHHDQAALGCLRTDRPGMICVVTGWIGPAGGRSRF